MSRTYKDRKWTLKMRDSGEFVPRERVYGRRVSAAEVLAALGGGRVREVVSAVGEVERDSEVARLELLVLRLRFAWRRRVVWLVIGGWTVPVTCGIPLRAIMRG